MNPGIDSRPGRPVRQPYFTYRPARGLHRLAKSIPWNRFLGTLNVYKFGLRGKKRKLIAKRGRKDGEYQSFYPVV
jgi:hypothetical protein